MNLKESNKLIVNELNKVDCSRFVYLPIGKHSIMAHRYDGNGKQIKGEFDVEVNQETFEKIVENLKLNVGPNLEKKVWIDYSHNDDLGAAGWITQFHWDPAIGIIAECSWTNEAKTKIQDGAYKYFSPSFYVDDDSKISEIALECGGLVNNPAFQELTNWPIQCKGIMKDKTIKKVDAEMVHVDVNIGSEHNISGDESKPETDVKETPEVDVKETPEDKANAEVQLDKEAPKNDDKEVKAELGAPIKSYPSEEDKKDKEVEGRCHAEEEEKAPSTDTNAKLDEIIALLKQVFEKKTDAEKGQDFEKGIMSEEIKDDKDKILSENKKETNLTKKVDSNKSVLTRLVNAKTNDAVDRLVPEDAALDKRSKRLRLVSEIESKENLCHAKAWDKARELEPELFN